MNTQKMQYVRKNSDLGRSQLHACEILSFVDTAIAQVPGNLGVGTLRTCSYGFTTDDPRAGPGPRLYVLFNPVNEIPKKIIKLPKRSSGHFSSLYF